MVRLRLEIPLLEPTEELSLDDTSSIVVPDSMSVSEFEDSDRFLAHFDAGHTARIDHHTRRVDFALSTWATPGDMTLSITGAGRRLREFHARTLPGHAPVSIRWDLCDSSGTRLPRGAYTFVVHARSDGRSGISVGVVQIRP